MNYYSDYGSGSSRESNSPLWGVQDTWEAIQINLQKDLMRPRSSSFTDKARSVPGTCTLEAKMKEFRMNGFDSPYYPEDEKSLKALPYSGMGPTSGYLRQKSWPEPEKTPSVPLPQPVPQQQQQQTWLKPNAADILLSARPNEENYEPVPPNIWDGITEEQMRVISTVPGDVLYALLKALENNLVGQRLLISKRPVQEPECRFCKSNGERAAFCRSHALRVRGRVSCPVLRALRCPRCGAAGDRAHTLKYCPLASPAERQQSAAMMRSVRMASGKRRNAYKSAVASDYVLFGETSPAVVRDGAGHQTYETYPLDPIWEALEKKLTL